MSDHPAPTSAPGRAAPAAEQLDDAAALFRALSNPLRVRIVTELEDTPRCVHELVDALGVEQPLVSQHLRVLRQARLLATTKRGREVEYSLADHHVADIVRDAISHTSE